MSHGVQWICMRPLLCVTLLQSSSASSSFNSWSVDGNEWMKGGSKELRVSPPRHHVQNNNQDRSDGGMTEWVDLWSHTLHFKLIVCRNQNKFNLLTGPFVGASKDYATVLIMGCGWPGLAPTINDWLTACLNGWQVEMGEKTNEPPLIESRGLCIENINYTAAERGSTHCG